LKQKQNRPLISDPTFMNDPILIALIGGGFSIIVALIEFTRRQNNRDHGENSKKLDYLAELFRDHLKGHK